MNEVRKWFCEIKVASSLCKAWAMRGVRFPQRICRGTLILERRPFLTNMLVIVVEEDLGF